MRLGPATGVDGAAGAVCMVWEAAGAACGVWCVAGPAEALEDATGAFPAVAGVRPEAPR